LFVALSLLKDVFTRPFGVPAAEPGLLNALLIAPLFEEILFRGFFLGALQSSGVGFWTANVIVALMFLGIHLPGWYFMASPSLTQGAAILGILLVGLGAGFARARSGSLSGSIAFHVVNNLYSAFLR
jgi:membrane protease YdiL (CAAX protease family)